MILVFPKQKCAKALQAACRSGSFTVEAAFIVPLFLFAAVVVIGLFPMLKLQTEVNSALQYAARTCAVSYRSSEETALGTLFSKSERALFFDYLEEHSWESSVLADGWNSITLTVVDPTDDYVTLVASYEAQLPIAFWNLTSLPVEQCVKMKKWTGASGTDMAGEDGDYVYITPTGSAYHSTTDCPYLKLSIRSVSVSDLGSLRNKSGGIYYPCKCYNGSEMAYITDYGTEYHSDLECSSLKRTIYRVTLDQVGNRHACAKCY